MQPRIGVQQFEAHLQPLWILRRKVLEDEAAPGNRRRCNCCSRFGRETRKRITEQGQSGPTGGVVLLPVQECARLLQGLPRWKGSAKLVKDGRDLPQKMAWNPIRRGHDGGRAGIEGLLPSRPGVKLQRVAVECEASPGRVKE